MNEGALGGRSQATPVRNQGLNLQREEYLTPRSEGAGARITRIAERSERLRSQK